MDSTTFMLLFSGAVGPWLTALLRRRHWDDDMARGAAVMVAAACYVAGQWSDGVLGWPLSSEFLTGLAASVGLQQVGYAVYKRSTPRALEQVERIGQ